MENIKEVFEMLFRHFDDENFYIIVDLFTQEAQEEIKKLMIERLESW